MSRELRGAPVRDALRDALRVRVQALAQAGVVPRLAVLQVGDDPGSQWYARSAARACEAVGAEAAVVSLSADTAPDQALQVVRDWSADPAVHGILVLRPLPAGWSERPLLEAIAPHKDVDGATAASMAGVYAGQPGAFAPCTAEAVMALLDHYGCELDGRRACVVGRSLVVGRPVAALLQARQATVSVCHTHTLDPAALCREADLVVAAAGTPGLVRGSWVAPGAWVVDVGTSEDKDGRLVGDVDQAEVGERAGWLTPVPGGVGAVTTAVLTRHVVEAAEGLSRG